MEFQVAYRKNPAAEATALALKKVSNTNMTLNWQAVQCLKARK